MNEDVASAAPWVGGREGSGRARVGQGREGREGGGGAVSTCASAPTVPPASIVARSSAAASPSPRAAASTAALGVTRTALSEAASEAASGSTANRRMSDLQAINREGSG